MPFVTPDLIARLAAARGIAAPRGEAFPARYEPAALPVLRAGLQREAAVRDVLAELGGHGDRGGRARADRDQRSEGAGRRRLREVSAARLLAGSRPASALSQHAIGAARRSDECAATEASSSTAVIWAPVGAGWPSASANCAIHSSAVGAMPGR